MSYAKKVLKLYYTSGSSDKEYHAIVEASADGTGYHVYGMNGRRGAANTKQNKTSTPVTLSSAESLYSGLVEAKRKKGYTTRPAGVPHAGIFSSDAIITGAASAPTTSAPATPLVPMAWFNTADESEFDTLLEDDEFVAQELVAGQRVMVEVTAGRVRGVDVSAGRASAASMAISLPATLTTELLMAVPGFVLDGLYDAATSRLAVVDGYRIDTKSPATEGASAPFDARMSVLVSQFAKAKGKHVEVMKPYLEDDKGALAYAMQDHGRKQMMLRKVHSCYETGAKPRSDAAVLVHNF
jgi:predicted DNA-binding WGR domain protein